MRTPAYKIPGALQHGVYSTTAVFPGENQAAFDKLHRELIDELAPKGALEDDIVATIARLIWRKQNLATLHVARLAQNRLSSVFGEMLAAKFPGQTRTRPESEKVIRAAEDQVRKEFGNSYGLVEIGEAASFNGLDHDLDIEERFGSMIDKCLKRLLYVRGLKSLSGAATSAPAQRVAGPSKAT